MRLNNTDWQYTHPETLKEVHSEFKRLFAKNPTVDGAILWQFARDYAWTLALADTALFKQQWGLK
jgi:hypothetical protein